MSSVDLRSCFRRRKVVIGAAAALSAAMIAACVSFVVKGGIEASTVAVDLRTRLVVKTWYGDRTGNNARVVFCQDGAAIFDKTIDDLYLDLDDASFCRGVNTRDGYLIRANNSVRWRLSADEVECFGDECHGGRFFGGEDRGPAPGSPLQLCAGTPVPLRSRPLQREGLLAHALSLMHPCTVTPGALK